MTKAARVTPKGARKPTPRGAAQATITSFLEPEEVVLEPEQVEQWPQEVASEVEQVEEEAEEVVLLDENSDEAAGKSYFSPQQPFLVELRAFVMSRHG